MQIETYEQEEVTGELGVMAADSEALELCSKLGLEGQLAQSNTGTATRFPYPQMSKLQRVVYGLHCPEATALERYKLSIIPLRVLQVAAYCKDSGFLHHMMVWHAKQVKEDPILVGHKESYGGDLYLLARWGEVLRPFDELQALALPLWKAKRRALLSTIKAKVEARQASIEEEADNAVLNGEEDAPTYHD